MHSQAFNTAQGGLYHHILLSCIHNDMLTLRQSFCFNDTVCVPAMLPELSWSREMTRAPVAIWDASASALSMLLQAASDDNLDSVPN